MRTLYSKTKLFCLMAIAVATFTSCRKDDNPTPPVSEKEHFVVLTSDFNSPGVPGYMTVYNEFPSGEIENNIQQGSTSSRGNGFQYYGDAIFQRVKLARNETGEDGIKSFVMDASGKLKENGFISASAANYHVYKKDLGFYFDADRGLLKIQIFNPSTMQRTGEIDLSEIRNTKYEYQSVGESIIVSKGDKLFVSITYGTNTGKGSFFKDPALGFAELAVIDIPSKKFEKVIHTDKVSYLGYPGNSNQMWTMGDDGALYFCSHGFSPTGAKGAAIVRIKKNDTDFDTNWVINADDYTPGTTFGTVAVKGGKLYTQVGSAPMNFDGILTDVIYDYYEFDSENPSKKGKKIEALPATKYAFQNAQTIVNIKDKLYFNINDNNGLNAYYSLDGKKIFDIKKGGRIMGFARVIDSK